VAKVIPMKLRVVSVHPNPTVIQTDL